MRLSPTARAMPSSLFRSSASITKMFTISMMPAMTVNEPIVVRNSLKSVPARSAASRKRSFTARTFTARIAGMSGCRSALAFTAFGTSLRIGAVFDGPRTGSASALARITFVFPSTP